MNRIAVRAVIYQDRENSPNVTMSTPTVLRTLNTGKLRAVLADAEHDRRFSVDITLLISRIAVR